MAFNLPIATYNQPGGNQNAALQMIMQLISQSQNGQNQARQANESRYNDILQQLADARGRSLGALDSLSGQEVTDANTSYDNMGKELLTSLADRGLGGSTKRIAVESMTKREKDAAVNRIKDAMALNRNATDERFTDKTTGVMERRSDPYPDTSNISGIIAQLAPLLGGMGGANGANNNSGFGSQFPRGWPPQQPNVMPQMSAGFSQPTVPLPVADPNQAFRARIQQLNAQNMADSAPQTEQKRRDAMAGLTTALNANGMDGDAQVKAALSYLQHMGWATQNPAGMSSAPVVGFAAPPPSYGSGYYGGYGAQQPSYSQPAYSTGRTPLSQRDPVFASVLAQQNGLVPALQQQRFDATQQARQKFLGSNDYQDAVSRLQAMGIGVRPNPDTPVFANGGGGFF